MAYYFIFPQTDTTLYSHPDRKSMNAGSDELLELVKEPGSSDQNHYPSRILIKFKNDDIIHTINLMNTVESTTFTSSLLSSVNLQLTLAEANNIVSNHVISAYAVSQSWNEGTGKYLNTPTGSDGASWEFRDNSISTTPWTGSNNTNTADWFGNGGGTGSIASGSSVFPQGGGTWYTGSNFYGTQQFLKGDDLNTDIEVKEIVHKWSASLNVGQTYPEGILNYGFLLKTMNSIESNASSSFGELQYFSSNTHTIYPPKLCFKWDDSIHNFQSSAKTSGELSVSLYRNQKEYNQNDIATFRVNVRDKYPTRTFVTSSNYLEVGYLTTSSFYSIRDAHTEEEIIPFDNNYTKMSADSEGMYFKIYMRGLQPERYYRILFKHKNNEGTTIYDNNYYFKVIR